MRFRFLAAAILLFIPSSVLAWELSPFPEENKPSHEYQIQTLPSDRPRTEPSPERKPDASGGRGKYLLGVKGGAIDPNTGKFYPDVGTGVIDPSNGYFYPYRR